MDRYLYVHQEIGKATSEINQRAFIDSGGLHPTQPTYAWAQHNANMNNDFLGDLKIYPRITAIRINDALDTV